MLRVDAIASAKAAREPFAGTDVHGGRPDYPYICSAPYGKNVGPIFIPGPNTWHAVGKRPLNGAIRKSIIIDYVAPDWRDKYELA